MLANLVIEQQTIRFKTGEFVVRGIGLDTITALFHDGNREDMETAVGELEAVYRASQGKDNAALTEGLTRLVVRLPALTAKLIARAADEPGEWEKVMKLPLPVQLDTLLAIGRMTFDGEDSIKNFVSGLTTMLASITKAAKVAGQIRSPPGLNG